MDLMSKELEENNVCMKPEDDLDPDRISMIDDDVIYYTINSIHASENSSGGFAHRINMNNKEKYSVYDKDGETENLRLVRKEWTKRKYTPKAAVMKHIDEPAPSLDELAIVGEGRVAKHVNGTLKRPELLHDVKQNSLFIDGKVNEMDVKQNDIGDCYFLSAILQVIHYDGDYLMNMMRVLGDEVYVDMYHREGDVNNGYRWVRRPIAVKWGVGCKSVKKEDGKYLSSVYGTHFRVKYDPEDEVKWSANFERDTFKISKTFYYQAAMWVQCLERAYQAFVKKYGKYGTGDEISRDRIDGIDGGKAGLCLNMIYGEDVVPQECKDSEYDMKIKVQTTTGETEQSGLEDGSENLISSLADLAGTQDGSKQYDTHVNVSVFDDDISGRIQYYSKTLVKQVEREIATTTDKTTPNRKHLNSHERARFVRHLKRSINTLQKIDKNVTLYLQQSITNGREGEKTFEQEQIAYELHILQKELMQNTEFQMLGLKDYISLRSSLATLIGYKGKDIYMYTRHAYNIKEIHFVDKDGNSIDIEKFNKNNAISREGEFGLQNIIETSISHALNVSNKAYDIDALKKILDLDATKVVIQNPHGETKAIYPGEKEEESESGTWTTSLRELLVNTSQFTSVKVRNHRHDKEGTK